MRDSVPYPLVEEHHAADGRCSVDGLPRGGRDTAVRRTALSAPPARLTPVHASSIGCPEYVDSGRPVSAGVTNGSIDPEGSMVAGRVSEAGRSSRAIELPSNSQ